METAHSPLTVGLGLSNIRGMTSRALPTDTAPKVIEKRQLDNLATIHGYTYSAF